MLHSQILKSQFSYNKTQVLWLTKMTEDEYNEFVLHTAFAWVSRYVKGVDPLALTSCKLFLNWWCFIWQNYDNEHVLIELYHIPDGRLSFYRSMHQFVFDEEDKQCREMQMDFRNMREDFINAIEKHSIHEA